MPHGKPKTYSPWLLSCLTKESKLRWLKNLGITSSSKRSRHLITNVSPAGDQPTMLSELASSTIAKVRSKKAGSGLTLAGFASSSLSASPATPSLLPVRAGEDKA